MLDVGSALSSPVFIPAVYLHVSVCCRVYFLLWLIIQKVWKHLIHVKKR